MTTFSVRAAQSDDAAAVARVNRVTWRTAFNGLVPGEYLDELNLEESIDQRTESFRKRMLEEEYGMFVAEADGRIVGFADGGRTRSPELPFAGELYAIYVLQEWQTKGVGRALTRAIVGRIEELGLASMIVWTFERSVYRKFYESLGAAPVPGARYERDFGGTSLAIVGFGWTDFRILNKKLESRID